MPFAYWTDGNRHVRLHDVLSKARRTDPVKSRQQQEIPWGSIPISMQQPEFHLSRRQREVLEWAAIGKTDSEISTVLGISERTVKFHMAGARQRLNAANRAHAVARAISLNLIDLP